MNLLYARIEGTVNGVSECCEVYLPDGQIDGFCLRGPVPEGFIMERFKLFYREATVIGNSVFFKELLEVKWGAPS